MRVADRHAQANDFTQKLLKCKKEKNLAEALRLHDYFLENGVHYNASTGNSLVSLLVDVGSLEHAQQVFDILVPPPGGSWNSLIIAYVKQGYHACAVHLYNREQVYHSLRPNVYTFVALLKGCTNIGNLAMGCAIHAEISRKGILESNVFVGSTLVDMYAKCGCLSKAQEVFDMLPIRNVVAWTTLITCYIENGLSEEACLCYQDMKQAQIPLDSVTFVCGLKACGLTRAVPGGQEIHVEVTVKGFDGDILVGSALVDMYAKCGLIESAHDVFYRLQTRDVVSWNSLIVGYLDHGMAEEALHCFQDMKSNGIFPDNIIISCVLRVCGSLIANECPLYGEIVIRGLEQDHLIGNALVVCYIKCYMLAEAYKIFSKLPVRTIISWNCIISGYIEHGDNEEALNCLSQMQAENVVPDSVTYISILKACSRNGSVHGCMLHLEIVKKGLDQDLVVSSSLVYMYAKCALRMEAQVVFDKIKNRDEVTWNTLISGYVEQNCNKEVMVCMEKMQQEGIRSQSVTYISCFKACILMGQLNEGRDLHAEVLCKGLEEDNVICSSLVDMYSKGGLISEAHAVCKKLKAADVVSWNALVIGYVNNGYNEDALLCLEQMQCENVCPDDISFICGLKASSNLGAIGKGQEIYSELIKRGYEGNIFVGNTLVDMFLNCGLFAVAQKVFLKLPYRTVVSWNSIIVGYGEQGYKNEALHCFKQMQQEGVSPDEVTFICVLKVCESMQFICGGQEIHADITRKGFDAYSLVGNALVEMYAKGGLHEEAQDVLERVSAETVGPWNALLVHNGEHQSNEEMFKCLEQMQQKGVVSDEVTYMCCLRNFGDMGIADKSQGIHVEVSQRGLENDVFISDLLIDAYGKCGFLMEAQYIFEKLSVRTIYSYNAIIAAVSQLGKVGNLLDILDGMMADNLQPNPVTVFNILNACNHLGLMYEGEMWFDTMFEVYGIITNLQHYTCMVDLLGRAGCLDVAIGMIECMPFPPSIVLWHMILSSCKQRGNLQLAEISFDYAMELDESDSAAYVSISNIYADQEIEFMQKQENKKTRKM